MTQRELAVKLGLGINGQSRISMYETDDKSPMNETIYRLAEALGCEPADLI